MRKYLYISLGGFCGAIGRYLIKNWTVLNISSQFPINTLVINIIGCFTLTFFLRYAIDVWELDHDLRIGAVSGFVGAFTTFSTLCREASSLFLQGNFLFSASYVILSLTAGFAAIYMGDKSARIMIKKNKLKSNNK